MKTNRRTLAGNVHQKLSSSLMILKLRALREAEWAGGVAGS